MEDWFADALGLHFVTFGEALIRMLLAAGLAMVLGLERYRKNKPIDYRAFVIISLASCVLAMMSQELYADFAAAENVVSMDLAKIVAGVLSGIGFLGAGAIIKQSDGDVVGTATGASIWASGALGLTIGFGFYALALMMFLFIAGILVGGNYLAKLAASREENRRGGV